MARFSIDGVFYFMAAAALLLAFLAAGRSLTTASPQHRERPFEILAPQAASLAHDQLGSVSRRVRGLRTGSCPTFWSKVEE
jgi:hypothetical protein